MQKNISFKSGLGFLLILTMFAACSSGSKSDSKFFYFNLEKGKSYNYEIVMDMDQEMMGQKNKIGFIAGYTVNVTGDDGKLKTLETEYNDFKMNMSMMGQEIKIDAKQKAEPMSKEEMKASPMDFLKTAFSGIIGKKFNMKVDTSGKILEVTGFDELLQSMIAGMSVDAEMAQAMEASLKNQFNPEKITETFSPMFNIYPGRPVKVGDSWERNYSLSGPTAAKYTTTFTVKSFEGDKVLLDTKTKIEQLKIDGEGEAMNLKLEGKQSGIMQVNLKNGLVIDSDLTQDFETSGGMKMTMKSKIKMKGKEK